MAYLIKKKGKEWYFGGFRFRQPTWRPYSDGAIDGAVVYITEAALEEALVELDSTEVERFELK